jgi:hypothetical protein
MLWKYSRRHWPLDFRISSAEYEIIRGCIRGSAGKSLPHCIPLVFEEAWSNAEELLYFYPWNDYFIQNFLSEGQVHRSIDTFFREPIKYSVWIKNDQTETDETEQFGGKSGGRSGNYWCFSDFPPTFKKISNQLTGNNYWRRGSAMESSGGAWSQASQVEGCHCKPISTTELLFTGHLFLFLLPDHDSICNYHFHHYLIAYERSSPAWIDMNPLR